MSKKNSSQFTREIKQIKSSVLELRKDADTNYHWILLKRWILSIGVVIVGLILGLVVGHFGPSSQIQITNEVAVRNMSPVIFDATITVCGLMIGFVPVISIFFVGEIRKFYREVVEETAEIKKKSKGDELKLVNSYLNLSNMTVQNIISGILKYTRDFVAVSVFLFLFLILGYMYLIGHGLEGVSLFVDFIVLVIVITGIFPIVATALYQPTLKLVRYVIPKEEIWKIEFD